MEDENGDNTDGVGELCVKSPSLFKEYWKLPEVLSDIIYLFPCINYYSFLIV